MTALLAGRFATRGHERRTMLAGLLVTAAATAALPFATSVPVVAMVLIVEGIAVGPFDVALFTLRQRRTDPAWFGRAFAVSMSVNYLGSPVGSALAGPLIGWSLNAALWAAVLAALVAAVFAIATIPAEHDVAMAVT